MAEPSNVAVARNQLVDDFNKIAADGEALLRAMASMPGEKVGALRASIEANLASVRQQLRDLQGAAYERTTAAARATDAYVRENPWALIGAAAAFGFVIGFMVRGDGSD